MTPRVTPPPDGTIALSAFREISGGRGRQYSEVWDPDNPWRACERMIRMFGAIGAVRDSTATSGPFYAVLDAVGEDGEILFTYDVPDAQAFRFIYRKLHLRVVSTDGDGH